MKFDLAELARRHGKVRRRSFTAGPFHPPAMFESDLASIYLRVLRRWRDIAKARLLPVYVQSVAEVRARDDIGQMQGAGRDGNADAQRLVIAVTPDVRRWAVRVAEWHAKKWNAALTPSGVDLSTIIHVGEVEEPISAIVARNVALITNVSDEARGRIADIMFRGFTARAPARDIAREIDAALQLGRPRSIRIASDQTAKLSADLDTARMKQAGIDEWIWIHSGKVHFRPEHKARDGNVYTWENAPTDMPGQLPFCGCKKQGVFKLD